MRGPGIMRSFWMAGKAKARDERGVAMAEYLPLLAVLGLVVFFSFSFLGPWAANHLGVAALSVEYGDYVAGECPSGDWYLVEEGQNKKNGQNVNQNGDYYICDKQIPGGGNGNTNQNNNVKDNNSYPWDNNG